MNRVSKVLVGILLLVTGLAIGFKIGYQYGYGWNVLTSAIEQQHYDAFAKIQNEAGSIESREEAIKQYIAIVEKRSSSLSPIFTEKTYAVDMALSYARLSILASEKGSAEQAKKYINQASSYCPQVGWQECNQEIILNFAERVKNP